jgi:tRNA(fMet)-specific endonuclease VapC
MKYLLDTNICIYIINQRPPHVLERFRQEAIGDVGISSITAAELAL